MKASRILLLILAATGWAAADVPRKAPITKYTGLWNNSPFTSKPPPVDPGPAVNPLEDYALLGVSPIGGGYRVTLINKKKPEERVTVDSDKTSGDYKILAVTRKAGDPLGTVVRMMAGSMTGTVAFDEKLLTIAAPAAPKPNPNQPQLQPGQQGQPQLQPSQMPQRQPRPRVVPPPTPGAANPQVQPQQQGGNPQFNNQGGGRPDRRGGRDR